jgi:hypothetical protein
MSRALFAARFGEEQADQLQAAAESHKNGVHDVTGSDPFRWAVIIALGYQCAEVGGYRDHHGITAPWGDIEAWLKEPEQREWLASHDGDMDYLSLMAGTYNAYMPEKESTPA